MNENDKKKEDILDYDFYSEFSPHYEPTKMTETQGKLVAYGSLVLFVILMIALFYASPYLG